MCFNVFTDIYLSIKPFNLNIEKFTIQRLLNSHIASESPAVKLNRTLE